MSNAWHIENPGTPAEHTLNDYADEIDKLEKQLKHYRGSVGGVALDWMSSFKKAPLWARIALAVTVGKE